MARDQISVYVWLVDTIRRHKRITRQQICDRWLQSPLSSGKPLSRRTFHNYKEAAQTLFNIIIDCDPATYEYYIRDIDERRDSAIDWIMDSTVTNELITSAADISGRILLEEVPSARAHLPVFVAALRSNNAVVFDYHPYTRSLPTTDVAIEPYFTKIFKQRWYVVGRVPKEGKIKTYALDRMSNVRQQSTTFKMPPGFDPAMYFDGAFGLVVDQSPVREVVIRADSVQAKYFRALPLHRSQRELVHEGYSVFYYDMRVTPDLVAELLSLGSKIEVIAPRELRAMIATELRKALAPYQPL